MAITNAVLGIWALLFPHRFYTDFPLRGRHWVSMLPNYNEHLLRDFGGLNLGFAVMFGIAALKVDRLLVNTVLVGYLCSAIPHLLFHLRHLEHFPMADVIGQVVSLSALVALPLILLWLIRRP